MRMSPKLKEEPESLLGTFNQGLFASIKSTRCFALLSEKPCCISRVRQISVSSHLQKIKYLIYDRKTTRKAIDHLVVRTFFSRFIILNYIFRIFYVREMKTLGTNFGTTILEPSLFVTVK